MMRPALFITISLVLACLLSLVSTCDAFSQPRYRARPSTCFAASVDSITEREKSVQELLSACRQVGQVGSLATQEERDELEQLAQQLSALTDPKPARQPLTGVHELIYSAAPGGSSGRLVGPLYGKVTQNFVDEETFINGVKFGPLEASLRASRKIIDDTKIKVTFHETTIKLFGKTLVQKETSGGGVWKYLFYGKVRDEKGKEKLIRVMETPSLFVIEQPL